MFDGPFGILVMLGIIGTFLYSCFGGFRKPPPPMNPDEALGKEIRKLMKMLGVKREC